MAVRAVEEKRWREEGATAMLCAGGAQGRQAVAGYRPGEKFFNLDPSAGMLNKTMEKQQDPTGKRIR